MEKKMPKYLQVDKRSPKDILKTELYLDASMIRRILGCTYPQALSLIKKGIAHEKEQKLFVVEQQKKYIRTTTFRNLINL